MQIRLCLSFDKLKQLLKVNLGSISVFFCAAVGRGDISKGVNQRFFKPVKPGNKIGTIDDRAVMALFFRSYKGKSKTMYSNKHLETFYAVK